MIRRSRRGSIFDLTAKAQVVLGSQQILHQHGSARVFHAFGSKFISAPVVDFSSFGERVNA